MNGLRQGGTWFLGLLAAVPALGASSATPAPGAGGPSVGGALLLPAGRTYLEEPASLPPEKRFALSLNLATVGVGAAKYAAVYPLEASWNLGRGFAIGPTATFSGTYQQGETRYGLSGFGAQASYGLGRGGALSDGLYVQAFYSRYSVSASQTTQLMGMPVPLEGSVPVNSVGGTLGYQWVWPSGLRLSAGVRATYLASNSDGIEIMGESASAMRNDPVVRQFVDVPVLEDQSGWYPVPELSLGFAF
jgi:hypothetical protein